MKKEDLKKIDFKNLDHKKLLIICAIILGVCAVICAVLGKIAIINGIFSTIGGIAFVGVIVFGIMLLRKRLLEQKEKNFTCKTCGQKFNWDASKIQCTLVSTKVNTNDNGKSFYHFTIDVDWTCDACSAVNQFRVEVSNQGEVQDPFTLIREYYLGRIPGFTKTR